MTISRERAQEIANNFVEHISDIDTPCAVVPDYTETVEGGWVFFFNSVEFIETRDPVAALAGNGPIFVNLKGEITQLPSSLPWEEAIKDI